MTELRGADYVANAQIATLDAIRKEHGNEMALLMARGMITAACYMLRLCAGPRAAAAELYSMADRYAVE
jgi:hypothetical protein